MKLIRSIVLTCLGGLLPTASVGQTIVWTDANGRRIQRKDVNGGEVAMASAGPSRPSSAATLYLLRRRSPN